MIDHIHTDEHIRLLYFVACLPLQMKLGFSEIAPFIKDDVFVTKGLIFIRCISFDRDMSWQSLTVIKHSQVVQAACNVHLSSGGSDFKQPPIFMTF